MLFRSKQSKPDQEYNSHKETSAVQLSSLYKVSSFSDYCAMGSETKRWSPLLGSKIRHPVLVTKSPVQTHGRNYIIKILTNMPQFSSFLSSCSSKDFLILVRGVFCVILFSFFNSRAKAMSWFEKSLQDRLVIIVWHCNN